MESCPSCSAAVSPAARFCATCGAVQVGSDTPTHTSPSPGPESPPSDGGRFAPGTLLANRYRIIALVGRGGMGQVYRADDLKLGQAVALKFLPEALVHDGAALARFHGEVRVARQISHPNVCRVFDIGEVDGQHFLTMEYIDGEDLSSLIRRIGRLPSAKAVEIARQLCAGLAAAHDAGVLHRDLKPANVMIDGRGRARITDFGLAGLEAEFRGADVLSGTPAYMAPEQLDGKEVTRRSEVYALGLVLHEVFTGRRRFDATTLPALRQQREEARKATPSSHVKDLDPLVERIIQRCLEVEPARRPASVLQVAAALPGGNPLEAALLAGETPSPEMVAAAPAAGALRPRVAALCLAGILLLLVGLSVGDRANLHHLVPLEKSPEVLAERARNLIASFGYPDRPRDRAYGYDLDQTYLGYEGDPKPAPPRWQRLATAQPLTYFFWYRQSPVDLMPLEVKGNGARVSLEQPAPDLPGMVSLVMDPRGRLVAFGAVPPAIAAGEPERTGVDWAPFFVAAGLDQGRFEPTAPLWTPSVFADQRAAWTGAFADHPDLPLRIEAAAYRGRAVGFRLVAPWDKPRRGEPEPFEASQWAAGALVFGLVATVSIGAMYLARRNLRLGRGDRAGAGKVAAAAFVLDLAATVADSDLPLTGGGVSALLFAAVKSGLATGVVLWLSYLALEPYVRRNRPELLVSWSRLLAGEVRNPLLGRDVLIGVLMGLGQAASYCLGGWLKLWFSHPIAPNRYLAPASLNGFRHVVGLVLNGAVGALWGALAVLIFLALGRRLLRSEGRAAVFLWMALCAIMILLFARSWPMIVAVGLSNALMIVAVTRFGLVAGVVANGFGVISAFPFPTDFSVFYAPVTVLLLVTTVALAVFAFWTSLGGHRLVGEGVLDD